MIQTVKQQIREAAINSMTASGLSQSRFANRLGISKGTMSQIKNNNLELISDAMWNKIAHGIGFSMSSWQIANTRNFQLITNTLKVCHHEAAIFALAADAGKGKTTSCEHYANTNEGVVYLRCRESWTPRMFYRAHLQALGVDPDRYTTAEMVDVIVKTLAKRPGALVIWDEADKLRNKIVMFIELYNELKGRVGFFICGTPRLRMNIEQGAKKDKLGFKEVYSRLGNVFLALGEEQQADVADICNANGLNDEAAIASVWQEYMKTRDLRRVETLINKYNRQLKLVA